MQWCGRPAGRQRLAGALQVLLQLDQFGLVGSEFFSVGVVFKGDLEDFLLIAFFEDLADFLPVLGGILDLVEVLVDALQGFFDHRGHP